MRIEIEIPANEVAQTKAGFPVSIWIDGQEDQVIEGEIVKIRPRSTTRKASNVFHRRSRISQRGRATASRYGRHRSNRLRTTKPRLVTVSTNR